ncbi:MAG: sulfotransferase [Phycisphaerales bacterium]|nr:sulfotransferase [Phycisphaerales bacterium]
MQHPESDGASLDGAPSNPYLFVVGCQRSGTTMLQRMLDAHPRLAVAYDSLFITRVIKGEAPGFDPALTPDVVEQARSHPRFSRLGLDDEAVARAASASTVYSAFVSHLYDELALKHGKPLAGEKSPGYCRHLPRLHALLPWVRIVHLIRDGRDVALSIRDWGKGAAKLDLWKTEPIGVGALWWRRDIRKGCADGRALPPAQYVEIRYEDLVAEPVAALRDLSAFLNLEYDPAMASYHQGRTKPTPGLSAKAAWLPPTRGIRDWRTQLSDRDQALFEAIAGPELEMLGYERRHPDIDPAIAEVAGACEAWWAREMD